LAGTNFGGFGGKWNLVKNCGETQISLYINHSMMGRVKQWAKHGTSCA